MEVVVSVRAENLVAKLLGLEQQIRQSLLIAVKRLAIGVQQDVKSMKLSGQVLNVRTGTLRRSINQEVTEKPDGIFAIVGTNVEYAAIHEYGFSGNVNVKAHVRHLRKRGHTTASGKFVKGKLTGETAMVSAHTRHMEMPERSFLRSTLREWEPRIKDDLRAAVTQVIKA